MVRNVGPTLPLFLPGIVVWTAIAVLLSGPLGRFLGVGRPLAFALASSVGLILVATLSPLSVPSLTPGICDLSRIGLASLATLRTDYDALLNIILFAPLGVSLGLLPRTHRTVVLIAGAFSLTFLIEGTQLLVTDLGRGCESADMVDNTLGLVIGLLAGFVATSIRQRFD
jgi:VanZ family protein